MQSLAKRQIRSVVPGIVICLFAMGVAINLLLSKKLEKEFDELLLAKSFGLIALTEYEEDGFEIENYEVTLTNYTDIENADYFEFLTDEGQVVIKSLSLVNNTRLPVVQADLSSAYLDITLPDGRAGRVLRTRFLPRMELETGALDDDGIEIDAKILGFTSSKDKVHSIKEMSELLLIEGFENIRRVPMTLQLASSRENLDKLIRSIQFLFFATGLLTLALILYVLNRGTKKALEPLKNLSDQVAKLDERQLNQKLTLHEPVAELSQLVERFNYLLGRLQEAFNREKRFAGDMAHELRTPVSEIKSLLEVRKRWPEDFELQKNFFNDVESATSRMQRTIENLLLLTRAEGQSTKLTECDDLPELLYSRVAFFQKNAAERITVINKNISRKKIIVFGADHWVYIFDNLLQNAIDYSQLGSTIGVCFSEVAEADSVYEIEISNSVTDLKQQDLAVMFERLWRKDLSRTSDLHSGLGLALVSIYAQQVGAKIVTDLVDEKFSVRLRFKSNES